MKKTKKNKLNSLQLELTNKKTNSKFGGLPFVEDDFVWPTHNSKALNFMVQIKLSDMKHSFNWLSKEGYLLFFYDNESWGDSEDKGSWRVIYQKNPTKTMTAPENLDTEFDLLEKNIKFSEKETYPNMINSELSDDEMEAYHYDKYVKNEGHHVGGFPYEVQNDPERMAYVYKNGIEWRDLPADYKRMKLLLQIDSDDELNVMFGDSGILYFYIDEDEAINNDFDNVWMVLQCY